MAKMFYVDIPNPIVDNDDTSWINIGIVQTKPEAFQILKDKYGIEEKDAEVFITEEDDGKPEPDTSCTVFLESDEFGYEEFMADNLSDAFQKITNIIKNVTYINDGIKRRVGIVINDDDDGDQSEDDEDDDGLGGQDRSDYTDIQDRKSYVPEDSNRGNDPIDTQDDL